MQQMRYEPEWFHIGDADRTEFAVLYGVIAIATVWVFESIVHSLLFTSNLHISLGEVAALAAFKGSSLPGALWWASSRPRGAKRSRRAYIALILRLVVTLVDIAIIVLAVPQEIVLSENDVGSTRINMKRNGNKLLPTPNSPTLESNPCIWDKTVFAGFVPASSVLICAASAEESDGADPAFDNILNGSNENGVAISHNRGRERLVFTAQPSGESFYITHNLFVPARGSRGATTFTLPLPSDIAEQTVEALSNDTSFSAVCPKVSPKRFRCDGRIVNNTIAVRTRTLSAVLDNTYTTRVEAPEFKRLSTGVSVSSRPQIGVVNRPMLCVFPALIVLGALFVIDTIVKLFLGSDNLIIKLYYLAAEATGTETNQNPFFAADRRLMHSSADKGRGVLVGYLHNSDVAQPRT